MRFYFFRTRNWVLLTFVLNPFHFYITDFKPKGLLHFGFCAAVETSFGVRLHRFYEGNCGRIVYVLLYNTIAAAIRIYFRKSHLSVVL